MKILLVEDDAVLAQRLQRGLEQAGHRLHWVADGRRQLFRSLDQPWDLLILDGVPRRQDERSVVHTLRQQGVNAPVLLLTTLREIEQCAQELDGGADDFLVQPFDLPELTTRVAALARRLPRGAQEAVLRVADLELDLRNRTLRRGERTIALKPLEFRLLEYLMRRADHVVTRQMLLHDLWHERFGPDANVVESQVSRLRAKIDRDGRLIHTVRGTGYCLRAGA